MILLNIVLIMMMMGCIFGGIWVGSALIHLKDELNYEDIQTGVGIFMKLILIFFLLLMSFIMVNIL
jgi:hypothetical protein